MHPKVLSTPALRTRYGLDHKNTSLIWLLVIIAISLIGWLVWSASYYSNPKISTQLISFENKGTNQISLTYQIKVKNLPSSISCRLVARDMYRNIVGESNDVITEPTEKIFTRTALLNTLTTAVNADVTGCQ